MKKSSLAFSLIELSIVLIIIGFLVSAITGGVSLIESSKVSSVISKTTQWSQAMLTFKEKYFALPGDMSETEAQNRFGATDAQSNAVTGGNSDGLIGNISPTEEESVDFFHHLSLSGIIDQYYNGSAPSSESAITIGTQYPATKFGNDTYYYVRSDNIAYRYTRSNRIVLRSKSSGNTVINASIAYKIDNKKDDGKPFTGKIIAGDSSSLGLASSNHYPRNIFINKAFASTTSCATEGALNSLNSEEELKAATYNTSDTTAKCAILISIGYAPNKFNTSLPSSEGGSQGIAPSEASYYVTGSWSGTSSGVLSDGTTITGSCDTDAGYLSGTASLTWEDESWTTNSSCLSSSSACSAETDETYSISWSNTSMGQVADNSGLSCPSGYSGTPTRTCANSSGSPVWGTPTGCTRIQCSGASGSNITWASTNTPISGSTTVSGTCDSGYTGSPSRTCSLSGSTGVWGSVSGSCILPASCTSTTESWTCYGLGNSCSSTFSATSSGNYATAACAYCSNSNFNRKRKKYCSNGSWINIPGSSMSSCWTNTDGSSGCNP